VILGVWTEDLALIRQVFYHTPSPFFFALFLRWGLEFLSGANFRLCSSYLAASHIAGTTGVHHHFHLIEMRSYLLTFCLGWLRTVILLHLYRLKEDRITGMSHHTWLILLYFTFRSMTQFELIFDNMLHLGWGSFFSGSIQLFQHSLKI
jgi:hypothetical protein